MEISALPGTKTCATLPDSSKVWLNSMASLRYPQQFSGAGRMVELKGEALFDIKKDPLNPFIVSADGIRIEVTGTVFNVYSGLFPGCTEVTLIEGSVNLYKDENETQHADRTLEANQQAIYDKTYGAIRVSQVNASSFASWVTREFVFERTSMEDIARELERAFNVKIHINNDSIRKIHLNARFTHQESLDKILSILQIPANYIMYKKENGEIYIR
jgi:ferric-dicitrate binding protein FerR (iron transport regulator)